MFDFLEKKKEFKVGDLVEGMKHETLIRGRIAVYPYEGNGPSTVKLDNGFCFRPEELRPLNKKMVILKAKRQVNDKSKT